MTDLVAQAVFREDVQRLGAFGMKPNDSGRHTAFLFADTLTGAKALHYKIQHSHPVQYISLEAFRNANVTLHEHVERFSSEIILHVVLKEGSRGPKFSIATITEMAKTAAARFGKIMRFELADESDFAANWHLIFAVEYNSVADANDAILTTNPVNGLILPYGSAEVSTMKVPSSDNFSDTCLAHLFPSHWL